MPSNLVVSAISLSTTTALPGQTINATFTIRNTGSEATTGSTSFFAHVYWSLNNTISPNTDVPLNYEQFSSLGAGLSTTVTLPIVIPPSAVGSTIGIYVVVDPGDFIPETSDTDNVSVLRSVSVGATPPAGTVDDQLASTATAGVVGINGFASGAIETPNDTDWFRVRLTAGHTYQFDLEGQSTFQSTLADPFLRLRDAFGNSILSDDDAGIGFNSLITYTASTTGNYILSAGSAVTGQTGTYFLLATDVTSAGDDYAGTTATGGIVSVGGSSAGTLEIINDRDWFRVTLQQGRSYQFDLEGAATGQGSLLDPFLRLRDSAGASIKYDDDAGTGLNAQIAFTAAVSGTYYLSVGDAANAATGTYRLFATDVTGSGVVFTEAADIVTLTTPNGTWFALGGDDTVFGTTGTDVIDGGNGNDALLAGAGDDTLAGNSGSDLLYGQDGSDSIDGGAGDDLIAAGIGNDTVTTGDGFNFVLADDGADSVTGGAGRDLLYGQANNDTLSGSGGDDFLVGGDGLDTQYGGIGQDVLFGDVGNDTEYGGDDRDWVYGQTGDDTLSGGSSDDVIGGSDGLDTLYGDEGADAMFGETGNDNIYGGAGNDYIVGGMGINNIFLGAGLDILQSTASDSGVQYVYDYNPNDYEQIWLVGSGYADRAAALAAATLFNNNTIIQNGADQIVLVGINPNVLGMGNFVLF
jgi:Ca2+-binding RTX toxin-like protein